MKERSAFNPTLQPPMEPTAAMVRQLATPSGRFLDLHLVRFDAATFNVQSFATAGISLPLAVARSVVVRQAEYFYGRLAASAALKSLGSANGHIGVGKGREPVWPEGFVGSISHVLGLAAAVAGDRNNHVALGLDLERTAQGPALSALRAVALSEPELETLRSVGGALSQQELVTLSFSAKESLFKGAYPTVQTFFDFSAAQIQAIELDRGVVVLSIAADLHDNFRHGRRCEIGFSRLDAETFVTVFDDAVFGEGR